MSFGDDVINIGLGLYKGTLINDKNVYYAKKEMYRNEDMHPFIDEYDIMDYENKGISIANFVKKQTNLKEILGSFSHIFRNADKDQIFTIHLFSCMIGDYKISKSFSSSNGIDVDIDTFITTKMKSILLKNTIDKTYYCKTKGWYCMDDIMYMGQNFETLKEYIKTDIQFSYFHLKDIEDNVLEKIDTSLLGECFKGAGPLKELKQQNFILILGRLNDENVCMSLLCDYENGTAYYLYSVCIKRKFREYGILKQMFHYIALNSMKMNLYLDASNLVEEGLNQTSRLTIYSKMGFTIPKGNTVEIKYKGSIIPVVIKNVNRDIEKGEITYEVKKLQRGVKPASSSKSQTHRIMKIKTEDIVTCPTDQNGCKMVSNPHIILNWKKKGSIASSSKTTTRRTALKERHINDIHTRRKNHPQLKHSQTKRTIAKKRGLLKEKEEEDVKMEN